VCGDRERQLRWVWKNCHQSPASRRRINEQRIGKVAAELFDEGGVVRARWLTRLQRAIASGTDDEFRNHCSLEGLQAGVLVILVDNESLVQVMRIRWLLSLRELLAEQCRGLRITEIRFRQGRGGLSLAEMPDQEDKSWAKK